MAKYIVVDASLDSFDTPEQAMAALGKDGQRHLYGPALLIRAEIVSVLHPSVAAHEAAPDDSSFPDMDARRREYSNTANASNQMAKGGALVGGFGLGRNAINN